MGVDWLNFLKMMVIEEQAARDKYQIALDAATDPKVRALMERLRDEEAFHAVILDSEANRIAETQSK